MFILNNFYRFKLAIFSRYVWSSFGTCDSFIFLAFIIIINKWINYGPNLMSKNINKRYYIQQENILRCLSNILKLMLGIN